MDFDECDFLFDVMYLKGEMFLNENFPFSLRLFVHVYMFNLLHNMRKNRTIVRCTCDLRKKQSLHIDNFLRYFSCLKYIETTQGRIQQERVREKKTRNFSFFTIHLHARSCRTSPSCPPLKDWT